MQDIYSTVQVVFPEYIRPLLRSSKYSLALYIYRSPCWNMLFDDINLSDAQRVSIIQEVFTYLSKKGLALDINAFYMLHNIDARTKQSTEFDVGSLVDDILNQKIGQLDDLISKKDIKSKSHTLPKITTNGIEADDTKEIIEDNELLGQIVINTVNNTKLLELKDNTIQESSIKLLGKKPKKYFYDEEEEEEDESEECSSNSSEGLNEISDGNLIINIKDDKEYKTKRIRYKDNYWNTIASDRIQHETLDLLVMNSELEPEDLKQITTNYNGILAYIIHDECTQLFENAEIYSGEYYDLLMQKDLGIDIDELINQPSLNANIIFKDKKWKILKFKSDRKFKRLIKLPQQTISKFNWPKFEFDELNIDFNGQINDI